MEEVGKEGGWEGGREGESMKKRLRSQREKERWGKKEGGREGHKKTGKEMNATGTAPRKSNGGEANVQMSLLASPSPSPPSPFFLTSGDQKEKHLRKVGGAEVK